MNRLEKLEILLIKLYPETDQSYVQAKNALLEDIKYGEEEVAFHNLVAQLKEDKIPLSSEDKQVIDEIGESMWLFPFYQSSMRTKYWKDLIE